MNSFCKYKLVIIGSLFLTIAYGQSNKERAASSALFNDEDILDVEIRMNIKEVTRDKEERNAHDGVLRYTDENQGNIAIPIKIKVRGNNRAKVCRFPPLELNFKKSKNYDNLFSGQDKIKLVTHCGSQKSFNDFVLQEYLTYKHYSMLTDKSFKVRLLNITYIDSASNENLNTVGFLIEDVDVLAYRMGMVERERKVPNQEFCERYTLNLFTVFQYMIGNTDWSIAGFHNVKLIAEDPTRGYPFPVPYDFDFAGAIDTPYAVPDESLGILDVRTRVYRGLCRPLGEYDPIIQLFNAEKEEIYALYSNFELVSEKRRKNIIKYFDDFYEDINDPKKLQAKLNGACRMDHVHVK